MGFTQYVVLFPEKVTGKTEKIEKNFFKRKKKQKDGSLYFIVSKKKENVNTRARRRGFLCFARKKMRGAKNFSKKGLIFADRCDIIASVIRRYDGIGRRAGLKIQW